MGLTVLCALYVVQYMSHAYLQVKFYVHALIYCALAAGPQLCACVSVAGVAVSVSSGRVCIRAYVRGGHASAASLYPRHHAYVQPGLSLVCNVVESRVFLYVFMMTICLNMVTRRLHVSVCLQVELLCGGQLRLQVLHVRYAAGARPAAAPGGVLPPRRRPDRGVGSLHAERVQPVLPYGRRGAAD